MRLNKEERRVEKELRRLAGDDGSTIDVCKWNDRTRYWLFINGATPVGGGLGCVTPASALRDLKAKMRAKGLL